MIKYCSEFFFAILGLDEKIFVQDWKAIQRQCGITLKKLNTKFSFSLSIFCNPRHIVCVCVYIEVVKADEIDTFIIETIPYLKERKPC